MNWISYVDPNSLCQAVYLLMIENSEEGRVDFIASSISAIEMGSLFIKSSISTDDIILLTCDNNVFDLIVLFEL